MWLIVGLLIGCDTSERALEALSPTLLCDDGDAVVLTVTGTALQPVAGDVFTDDPSLLLPTLRFEPASGLAVGSAPATDRVITLPGDSDRLTWLDPETVEILVDAGLGLAPGVWDLVAAGPDGREERLSEALVVAGAPVVTGLSPDGVCHGDAEALTVLGEGFIRLDDGGDPSVVIADIAATVVDAGGCLPLAGGLVGEICASLLVEAETDTWPFGDALVEVANPGALSCSSAQPATLSVSPEPEITAVTPEALCRTGGMVTIEGNYFTDDMSVSLGEVPILSAIFVDDHTFQVEVGEAEATGSVDVEVGIPGSCSAELPDGLRVAPEPLVYYVDPPVAWSGAAMEVSAWVTDLVGEVSDAWLERVESGDIIDVAWSWDAADPGVVRVSLPSGLEDGTYAVQILQDDACPGNASGTLTITSDLQVSIEEVDPDYAWQWTWTSVEVLGEAPLPSGMVAFEDVPQVVLIGEDGTTATMRALTYVDGDELTGIVPHELPTGAYDVMVINPDGAIGVLEDGLTITEEPPPTITSVTPPSLPHTGDQPFEVLGRDFRDPIVRFTCKEGGATSSARATVDEWSYGSILGTVDTGSWSQAVCYVTVINDDGTRARWSAVSINNPAMNLFDWEEGAELNTPRRAPAAAAARTTPISRYVYAIGGDDGTEAGAFDSIEVASVGVYGTMDDWEVATRALPAPRTLAASVSLGRFIYLVGGNDGDGPVSTVWRAVVLDPLDVPWFEGLSVDTSSEDGLSAGTWTWRIAALFAEDDDYNPDGESLPGDPVTVVLPEIDGALVPTLRWEAVDGATGYRVYRTAAAGDGAASVGWVADVTDGSTSFQDTGGEIDPAIVPLVAGALGEWATLPALSTERESPCLALGPDPTPDPEVVYLYAAGGLDASGAPLDSVEVLPITVETEDHQTGDDWFLASVTLDTARSRCGGYAVDNALHSDVPVGETWVYFAGGESASRTVGTVDAGQVQEGGELSNWQTVDSLSPARAGFAFAAASNQLYAFGGQKGEPDKGSVSGELEAGDLPDLVNWNSLSISMNQPRVLAGSAQESAVIFVIGGLVDDDTVTATTDITNY